MKRYYQLQKLENHMQQIPLTNPAKYYGKKYLNNFWKSSLLKKNFNLEIETGAPNEDIVQNHLT